MGLNLKRTGRHKLETELLMNKNNIQTFKRDDCSTLEFIQFSK